MKVQNKVHSTLGASSSDRWFNCPGSVKLSEGQPDYETPAAKEGTAAHEVVDLCLKNSLDGVDFIGEYINDIRVSEAMAEAVQTYIDYVRKESQGKKLIVEAHFNLKYIDNRLFGTTDAMIINPKTRMIETIDFKYGAGHVVEAENNSQLMYYTLGPIWDYTKKDYRGFSSFKNTIVQPRAFHKDGPIRSSVFSWEVLLAYETELRKAIDRVDSGSQELKRGEHCTFCRAITICPEVKRIAQDIAKADFAAFYPIKAPDPKQLAPAQLAKIIQNRKILDAYLDACEVVATERLMAGEQIEGLKLVQGNTTKAWKDADKAEEMLYPKLGNMIYKTRSIRTPADMCSLFGEETIKEHLEYVKGNFKAVSVNNKRRESKPARLDFKE